jgi:plastocyanin
MRTAWTKIGSGLLAAAIAVAPGCARNEGEAGGTASPSASAGSPGGSPTAPSTSAPSAAKRPAALDRIKAPDDAGVIAGWVSYQGALPKPKPINFGAEKACADLNRDKSPVYENLVVNPNGTLKWTLVCIRGEVPGKHEVPSEPVAVDQIGCTFVPHAAAVMAGLEIVWKNSDPVSHNIRGTAAKNTQFNTIFSSKMSTKSKFEEPEFGIPLKCDIHFWMAGYVHVLPHPFFAITGDDGSFVLPRVPPGSYTLLAWHETLKTQTRKVTVSAGEVKEVEFTYSSPD